MCNLEDIILVCGVVNITAIIKADGSYLSFVLYLVYVPYFVLSLCGFINSLTSKQRTHRVECTIELKSI